MSKISNHCGDSGITRHQSLAGTWKLLTDPDNLGRESRWCERIGPEAQDAPVPGIIQQVFTQYHGVAWYWLEFSSELVARPNECSLLRFDAVDYMAEVWLNGVPVGGHEGGELPFDLDVTETIRHGEKNLLAVRVLNPTDEPIDGITLRESASLHKTNSMFPGGCFNFGGITAPVELITVPEIRISAIYAKPDPNTGTVQATVTIENSSSGSASGRVVAAIAPSSTGERVDEASLDVEIPTGESTHNLDMSVTHPHLWDLDDPYLYSLNVLLELPDRANSAASTRFGFRDFRVTDGYFRLNGRRIFLRCSHTLNLYPISSVVPPDPDMVRRDMLNAKTSGFNCIRFIAHTAYPEQLDLCDEMGLMIYEESMAGWMLGESPKMAERFDSSLKEMILRDRNHPCITIWGLLNETPNNEVFRHAVKSLSLVRSLDDTRLVLLNSGRFDDQTGIGSLSNPGSLEWEHQWGPEAPGADPIVNPWIAKYGGYFPSYGDAHFYPYLPQPPHVYTFLRSLGEKIKPVFLSEYGIGSQPHTIEYLRGCEQAGAREDLHDVALCRSMLEMLRLDWKKYGMEGVYPFLEDFFNESERRNAKQRLVGFDCIRSNPKICGMSLTSLVEGVTGEGLFTAWKRWKPGMLDAVLNGWAPLRWCLFVDSLHGYAGDKIKIEAVLANDGALKPGTYPVHFKVVGPDGMVWEKQTSVIIPEPERGTDGPLSVPVICEEITIAGPTGRYLFGAVLERGGLAAGGRLEFYVTNPETLPKFKTNVTLWGVNQKTEAWLTSRGIHCESFSGKTSSSGDVILVGNPEGDLANWKELMRRISTGSTAIFLTTEAFRFIDENGYWLPLKGNSRVIEIYDCIYHKENVAKSHPVLEGLQCGGIMDWDFYGQVLSHYVVHSDQTPNDTAVAGFAIGYPMASGYGSGVMLGSYNLGAGKFYMNTLRILENLGKHPAADRLLLNLLSYAQADVSKPLAEIPVDLDNILSEMGYDKAPHAYSAFKRKWHVSKPLASVDAIGTVQMPDDDNTEWQEVEFSRDNRCLVHFYELYGKTGGMIYSWGMIEAPSEQTWDMLVGADGPLKMWIDGEVVCQIDDASTPITDDTIDMLCVPVRLKKGPHKVTVAFERKNRAAGFYLRFRRIGTDWTSSELTTGLAILPEVNPETVQDQNTARGYAIPRV